MTDFGLHITLPIIVSFVTSIIVTAMGFVVGARIAKERADRPSLRDLYKSAYAHFRELKDSIDAGQPKTWDSYARHDEGKPLIFRYTKDGTINQLPTKIGDVCQIVERETLAETWKFMTYVEEHFSKRILQWSNENITSAAEVAPGRTYTPYFIGKLLLGETPFDDISRLLHENKIGVGLELSVQRSRSHMLFLYPSNDIDSVVASLRKLIEEDEEGSRFRASLKRDTRLDDLLATLASRIKDPHPLGETILSSLGDLLRR